MDIQKRAIHGLFGFAIDGIIAVSKSTFESAQLQHEQVGRGAFVVSLNEKHLYQKQRIALVFMIQEYLCKYEFAKLNELVATYDPQSEFIVFVYYELTDKTGDLPYWDVVKIARDANRAFKQRADPTKVVEVNLGRCAFCSKTTDALKLCAKCSLTSYCSRVCQKHDWQTHKPVCKSLMDLQKKDPKIQHTQVK